jgi:hypothetical protein
VTGWLTRHPTTLNEKHRAGLKEVLAHCPELDMVAGHVRDFGEILTDRLGPTLPTWIDAVDASQLPRFDKLGDRYRAGVVLASLILWLREPAR